MNLKRIFKITILVLLAVVIVFTGCEKKKAPPPVAKKEAEQPKFEFKEEIYGDPEIFSTPRVQFVWQAPGLPSDEIWSMRLDGSDLRRAVKAELLWAEQATGLGHDPVRSPDNRFIVVSMRTARSLEKHLIDLKTQTKTIIMSGGLKPYFAWRPDSKSVVFISDPGLLEYFVETKELRKLKPYEGYGHYILQDGRFVVVTKKGVSFYTPDQKFIRAIDIFAPGEIGDQEEWVSFYHRISWDGKFMVYELGDSTRFIRLDEPKNPIWTTKKRYDSGGFDYSGKYFYYSIGRLDLKTNEDIALIDWPCIKHDCGGAPLYTTIFNLGAAR
ncbi:MAG: hypothetical protein M0036_15600 [Desulfobacteraceae bacterium]|nr:hypothetical protein [Desulfobacteraceae bacterium]